jgi:hypothetical protein
MRFRRNAAHLPCLEDRLGGRFYNIGVNKLKAVVDRLVRETGLSRTVSRRIAHKINHMAGKVNWATPLQGGQGAGPGAGTVANAKSAEPANALSGGRIVLPKIPASKPVVKSSRAIRQFRPR